jgi:NADPH:quinone reductase-like Zn-dependent oxidoreductase
LMLWSLLKGKVKSLFGYGNYTLLVVQPCGKQLTEIARLLEAGRVRPVIDRVLPLENAAEGHEYLERGHARGKVILTVNKSSEG